MSTSALVIYTQYELGGQRFCQSLDFCKTSIKTVLNQVHLVQTGIMGALVGEVDSSLTL
jgi:hypothetical protein